MQSLLVYILGSWIILQVSSPVKPAFYPFFQPLQPARGVQVMAHRGAAECAPENTLPALQAAVDQGYEWAEIDIRLTQNGHHIIFHDSPLDNKTNGTGMVRDRTWEYIQNLDAGSWFASRFQGTPILSLQEALAFAKGKINLYLDCKEIDPPKLVKEILSAAMENQVAVFADPGTLHEVNRLSEHRIPVMVKWKVDGESFESLLRSIRPAILEVDSEDLTPHLVNEAHDAGVRIQVKTLDEWDRIATWRNAIQAGADYIQTDHAAEVQALLFKQAVGDQHRTWISAHRGASTLAPENTQSSIQKAIDLHCDFIEVDVRTTADGQLILLHDSTVKRTIGQIGLLREFPFDRLRQLSAGEWFGKSYKGEKVPTLAEAIQQIRGKARLYLDNKETEPEPLIAELRKLDYTEDVVIYGDPKELAALKRLQPALKIMPPLRSLDALQNLQDQLHPYAVDTAWEILSSDLIKACHSLEIKVFSDALGENERPEEYLHAMEMGIDLIQTDYPLRVQRAVEQFSLN